MDYNNNVFSNLIYSTRLLWDDARVGRRQPSRLMFSVGRLPIISSLKLRLFFRAFCRFLPDDGWGLLEPACLAETVGGARLSTTLYYTSRGDGVRNIKVG